MPTDYRRIDGVWGGVKKGMWEEGKTLETQAWLRPFMAFSIRRLQPEAANPDKSAIQFRRLLSGDPRRGVERSVIMTEDTFRKLSIGLMIIMLLVMILV
jgi:hypothetical protein